MLRKAPSDYPSAETGIDRRLAIATYGCSITGGIGLLYMSLTQSGDWTTAWIPFGTGLCLALAGASGLGLRARLRRRPPTQPERPMFSDASFANPEVWREIDSNRDLLYALLEVSRRRMRDAVSRPHTPASGIRANDPTFSDDRAKRP